MSRRTLLMGTASTALLAACTGSTDPGGASTTGATPPSTGATGAPTPPSASDVAANAIEAAGLSDAAQQLGPQTTFFEMIAGHPQYLQYVVTDVSTGALVTDPTQLWLVQEGTVVDGPLDATFVADDRIPSGGLHSVPVTVDTAGVVDLVVATADGTQVGTGTISAVTPADSVAPGPGEVLSVVDTPTADTPTVDAPGDMADLCTRQPDCTLHDLTLAEALDNGLTVLCIATPQFCSSAICGPVLDDVLSVADSGDHPDVTFVHVEPYVDGATLTPTTLVEELLLPSEPWTFVLQGDGTVLHRFPGPVLPSILDEILTDAA